MDRGKLERGKRGMPAQAKIKFFDHRKKQGKPSLYLIFFNVWTRPGRSGWGAESGRRGGEVGAESGRSRVGVGASRGGVGPSIFGGGVMAESMPVDPENILAV